MLNAVIGLQPQGISISEGMVAGVGRSRLYGAIADGILKARENRKRTLLLKQGFARISEGAPKRDRKEMTDAAEQRRPDGLRRDN